MKDYYLLIGLNSKEVKITKVNQNNNGLIEITIENRKNKVRCPVCNKFTSSVHDKLKPIRSAYLDSCGSTRNKNISNINLHTPIILKDILLVIGFVIYG